MRVVIERANLDQLLDCIKKDGYTIIGPTVREDAVVYDEIQSVADLPKGIRTLQEKGKYRLEESDGEMLFDYVSAVQSWKRFLYPPEMKLFSAKKGGKGFKVTHSNGAIPKFAFVGVRSCELHAILIQDKIFQHGAYKDSYYNKVRKKSLLIAVNCGQAASTCFCTSMNTGPHAKEGYDISLTEVSDNGQHYFVTSGATKKGSQLLETVLSVDSTDRHEKAADGVIFKTVEAISKKVQLNGTAEILKDNIEHSYWREIGSRCLSCTNCTMVCPTCFCSTVEDVTDLTGSRAERTRKWDSCFNLEFSYVFGGSVRMSSDSRYRQWMLHKFAYWQDQFGMPGCVGCGRCTTWCPSKIDITEEVDKFRKISES